MSCMVMTVQRPCSRTTCSIILMVMCWLAMSRLLDGSSRTRSSGSRAMGLAICTFWNSPPLISSTKSRDLSPRPRDSITFHAISRSRSENAIPMCGRLPMRTESKTVVRVTSAFWGTYPTSLAISLDGIADRSLPHTLTVPESGLCMLHMQRRRVVFPTPFGPSMDTISFFSALSETPFKTSFDSYEKCRSSTSRTVTPLPSWTL